MADERGQRPRAGIARQRRRQPDDLPQRSFVSVAATITVAVLIVAFVFLALVTRDQNSAAPPDPSSPDSTLASEVPAPPTTLVEDEPVEVTAFSGSYVQATLEDKDFVLAGVVPSADLAGELLKAAQVAYSPYVRSELMVDEQLERVDWLEASPQAIVLLPTITDGSMLIAESQVTVSGRAPSTAEVEQLERALVESTGLAVQVQDVSITNLEPPLFVMAALDGEIVLSGRMPTEEIRGLLEEAAIAAYGAGNVLNELEVDPGVYSSLWMYNGGPLLQAMSVFPEYEMTIEGTAFSGFIRGGVTFEPGSAEFTPDYAQVLDVGVSVLTRDQSLQLVIEGHTDSDGPADFNLELSQARADAVTAYFVENGIDPSRLTSIGLGENEPVVPNDSVEAMARNRRIEFVLSTSRPSS